MSHIIFSLNILCFLTGFAAICFSSLIYMQTKKKVVLLYTFFLLFLMCIMINSIIFTMLKNYIYPNMDVVEFFQNITFLTIIIFLISFLGDTLFDFVGPVFIHELVGLKASRLRKRILFIVASLVTIVRVAFFVTYIYDTKSSITTSYLQILQIIIMCLHFGLIIYTVMPNTINKRKIGNKFLVKAIDIFYNISLVFVMLLLLSIASSFIIENSIVEAIKYILTPVYLFIISVLSIVFSYKYFSQPPFFTDNMLTDHFLSTFNISKRENDVILQAMRGHTTKEISDKLFISFKTVESHLYRIYSKTNVSNRVQLINLIQTNIN